MASIEGHMDDTETETDLEENGDVAVLNKDAADGSDSNTVTTPPELLKTYYFGCGPFHPKWLQVLANKKFFTILLCAFAFFESTVVTGKQK